VSIGGSQTTFVLSARPAISITVDEHSKLAAADPNGKPVVLDNPDVTVTPNTAAPKGPDHPTPAQNSTSVSLTAVGAAQVPAVIYAQAPVVSWTEPNFTISPIEGDPTKVKIEMKTGPQTANIAEAQRAKNTDGTLASSKFYLMYPNGNYTEYDKKEASVLPDGQQIPAKLDVTLYVRKDNLPQQPVQTRISHQTSSVYSTPPRHDAAFKVPLRMDKPGFGVGRPRLWLAWDVQHEIQVEPVQTKFGGGLRNIVPVYNIKQWVTGNLNGMKFLSNVYTEGSPAPRYFYLKKNKDDSYTIYGDDDIAKLKTIEKGKTN
jgi:hypothetical protein